MENDNILFEVETIIDKKCWREVYWSVMSVRDKLLEVIFSIGLYVGLFLMSAPILVALNVGIGSIIVIESIIFIATACDSYYGATNRAVNRLIKEYQKGYGTDCIHNKYTLVENYMLYFCLEKQTETKVSYHQFEWMKETEHYFLFKNRGTNTFFIFEKSGFVAGDVDAFRQFFQQYKYR